MLDASVRSALAALSAREGDLNKVPQHELAAAKRRMDAGFEANRLRPGDDGYEHDVRVDFGDADEACSWDEDDDEGDDADGVSWRCNNERIRDPITDQLRPTCGYK